MSCTTCQGSKLNKDRKQKKSKASAKAAATTTAAPAEVVPVCIQQCSKDDYKSAVNVTRVIDSAFNQSSIVSPEQTSAIFAGQFALGGLQSSSFNPVTGPFGQPANTYGYTGIYNGSVAYLSNPGEVNQTVTPRLYVWDCVNRTLCVERGWFATLTQDRAFTPTVTLGPGTGYGQDDFVLFQFDCDYNLVLYREYYDNAQFLSTYTTNYPPVCQLDNGSTGTLGCNDIPPCTDCDRDRALQIYDKGAYAWNLSSLDPQLTADIFVSLFADCGVWSTSTNPATVPGPIPQANFQGLQQIRNFALAYLLNPGETDQSVTTKGAFWDCNNRTLAVARTWQATLTAPRTFGVDVTLPAGTVYQQDDLVITRFDCDWKIVYYREYFDTTQYQTTYPTYVLPVCAKKCECTSCEQCFKHDKCPKRSCGSNCQPCLNVCGGTQPACSAPRSIPCAKCGGQ